MFNAAVLSHDSANYSCELRGPLSNVLQEVTHFVSVRGTNRLYSYFIYIYICRFICWSSGQRTRLQRCMGQYLAERLRHDLWDLFLDKLHSSTQSELRWSCGIAETLWHLISAVITGKQIALLPRWTSVANYKYQTKRYTHAHSCTLHTQQMVASTWHGDYQGGPSTPSNSLPELHTINLCIYLLT
jgi:hypothetical protein